MATKKKKQLIWHVGDPKTGTTSIQRAFEINAIEFKNVKAECFRPQNTHANAIGPAKALVNKDLPEIKNWFKKIRKWVNQSDADYLIVSAETAWNVKPNLLRNSTRTYLKNHAANAHVISYARPHASRFLAAYIQRTKTGEYKKTYAEFFDILKKQETLFYAERANRWERNYGKKYTLRPFVRNELHEKDAVHDFLAHTVGINNFSIPNNINENTSFSTRALSGLRKLHEVFAKSWPISRGQKDIARCLYHHHIPEKPSLHLPPKLDMASFDALHKTYINDAKELDKKYFSRPIMVQEFEKAREKTTTEPMDIEFEAHFTSQEQGQLLSLFNDVVRLYDGDNKLWYGYVQLLKDTTPLKPKQIANLELESARVSEMDAMLKEIAEIIR